MPTVPRRGDASLNAARRTRELAMLADRPIVDVLVVGGGVTGAGIALDAASRGVSVALVERHDLASGTSRWSSKLVHGGLRYLSSGNLDLARECAVERGILMQHTAPHLVRPLAQLVPVFAELPAREYAVIRAAFLVGDALRVSAGTSRRLLPRSSRRSAPEGAQWFPAVRRAGLRGGILAWDGQVVDDARLVVAIARTAASYGARVLTRCAAEDVTGSGAVLRDALTGQTCQVNARVVINAAGVWAGHVSAGLHLRPSRGTHLVIDSGGLGDPTAALTVPIPGDLGRFVYAIPAGDNRVFVGVTDVDAGDSLPDVPIPDQAEIESLLAQVNRALQHPIERGQVLGSFAGLRPLLANGSGRTADLSRRHQVVLGPDRVVSVVGGKLTTYRAMAQEAVDKAVALGSLDAGRCRTARLPLVGAAGRAELARIRAPARLVARYGTEARRLIEEAGPDHSLRPVAAGLTVTAAELQFGVRHEGALDEGDLLDRRTRIGLVPSERKLALQSARTALGSYDDP